MALTTDAYGMVSTSIGTGNILTDATAVRKIFKKTESNKYRNGRNILNGLN